MSAFDEDDFLIAIESLVPEALESRPWAELPDAGERLQALGEMGATLAQAIAMAYPEQRLPAWRAVALATLKRAPREAFNWAPHESMPPELSHSHKIHVGKGFMKNIFAPDEREAVIHALVGCVAHDPDRLDAWEQSVVQAKKSGYSDCLVDFEA